MRKSLKDRHNLFFEIYERGITKAKSIIRYYEQNSEAITMVNSQNIIGLRCTSQLIKNNSKPLNTRLYLTKLTYYFALPTPMAQPNREARKTFSASPE